MAISFTCGTCGKPYKVDERFAGKKAACRACGTVNRIPGEEGAQDVAMPGPAMTTLQTMSVRVPTVNGGILPVQAEPEESDADRAAALAAAEEGLELTDEPELAPEPSRPVLRVQKALPIDGCPNCGSALANGSTVCTSCGFNLKTGKKISTAVVADKNGDEGEEAESGETSARRPPTPALRYAALSLIIVGVAASMLPFFGLAALATIAPLAGAAMAMIGAAIYFIDGAWEWGLAGVGAMMVSIVILLVLGGRGDNAGPSQVANAAAPPKAVPATTQAAPADPGPKVSEVAPGKFSIRAPLPADDPVDYWREVLEDKDPKIRMIGIERLIKLPERFRDPATDAVALSIGDEDINIRRAVIKQLSLVKSPKTVAAAVRALDDLDPEIARQALKLLAQYKDDVGIEPLAKKYAAVGEPALAVLGGYGPSSREKVMAAYKALLDGGDAKGRAKIMEILARTDPAATATLLMANLTEGDSDVRHAAMARLAEMKHLPAIEPIAQRLKDDSEAAVGALIKFGPAAQKAVAGKLSDTDSSQRRLALGILKEIGDAQSLDAIKAAAKDQDLTVALAARDLWRKLEAGAFPAINEAMLDFDGGKEFVARSVNALKTLPVDEHQGAIARKLFDLVMGDGDAAIRAPACEALAVWADPATKDLIIASLKPDVEDAKRSCAIKLAVHFKDRRAVRPLCQYLAEGKGLPEVVPALREFDAAPEEFLIPLIAKGDATVQGNCFDLLRDIGTRRCFMALTAVTNNKSGDEPTKKHAKETMIAINRRLNTAAARKGTPTTRPTTLPQGLSAQH